MSQKPSLVQSAQSVPGALTPDTGFVLEIGFGNHMGSMLDRLWSPRHQLNTERPGQLIYLRCQFVIAHCLQCNLDVLRHDRSDDLEIVGWLLLSGCGQRCHAVLLPIGIKIGNELLTELISRSPLTTWTSSIAL